MPSFNITLLSLLLFSLCLSASARPCKTLFISSYSVSVKPLFPNSHNPNPNPTFIAVFTQISTSPHSTPRHKQPQSLFGFPYDATSLRHRSKDILSVVVALLFGVGCGALTAATMYLVWSMFVDRSGYEDEECFDDVAHQKEELKKFGYVKIPDSDPVKGTV